LQKLKRADKSTEEMRDRVYIGDQLTWFATNWPLIGPISKPNRTNEYE
jgi:hypothetical protein